MLANNKEKEMPSGVPSGTLQGSIFNKNSESDTYNANVFSDVFRGASVTEPEKNLRGGSLLCDLMDKNTPQQTNYPCVVHQPCQSSYSRNQPIRIQQVPGGWCYQSSPDVKTCQLFFQTSQPQQSCQQTEGIPFQEPAKLQQITDMQFPTEMLVRQPVSPKVSPVTPLQQYAPIGVPFKQPTSTEVPFIQAPLTEVGEITPLLQQYVPFQQPLRQVPSTSRTLQQYTPVSIPFRQPISIPTSTDDPPHFGSLFREVLPTNARLGSPNSTNRRKVTPLLHTLLNGPTNNGPDVTMDPNMIQRPTNNIPNRITNVSELTNMIPRPTDVPNMITNDVEPTNVPNVVKPTNVSNMIPGPTNVPNVVKPTNVSNMIPGPTNVSNRVTNVVKPTNMIPGPTDIPNRVSNVVRPTNVPNMITNVMRPTNVPELTNMIPGPTNVSNRVTNVVKPTNVSNMIPGPTDIPNRVSNVVRPTNVPNRVSNVVRPTNVPNMITNGVEPTNMIPGPTNIPNGVTNVVEPTNVSNMIPGPTDIPNRVTNVVKPTNVPNRVTNIVKPTNVPNRVTNVVEPTNMITGPTNVSNRVTNVVRPTNVPNRVTNVVEPTNMITGPTNVSNRVTNVVEATNVLNMKPGPNMIPDHTNVIGPNTQANVSNSNRKKLKGMVVSPIHGESGVDPSVTLKWSPVLGAKQEQLLFGESKAEMVPIQDYLKAHPTLHAQDLGVSANVNRNGISAPLDASRKENSFPGPGALKVIRSLRLASLKPETTYYWQIIPTDQSGKQIKGDIWSFTTAAKPKKPILISPSINESGVGSNVNLKWLSQDLGASYTQQLFFGESKAGMMTIQNYLKAHPSVRLHDQSASANIANQKEMTKRNEISQPKSFHLAPLKAGTTYYWQIIIVDQSGRQIKGNIWSFTTADRPNKPVYISPSNGEGEMEESVELSWTASHPDDLRMTYEIWYGIGSASLITRRVENWQEMEYTLQNLRLGVSYYWKIVVIDSNGFRRHGDIWSFTMKEPVRPELSSPQPADKSEEVEVDNLVLKWTSTNPYNDKLSYTVMFGDSVNTMKKVASKISRASYMLGNLKAMVTYYWQVIVIETSGRITKSAVWSFTTRAVSLIPASLILPVGPHSTLEKIFRRWKGKRFEIDHEVLLHFNPQIREMLKLGIEFKDIPSDQPLGDFLDFPEKFLPWKVINMTDKSYETYDKYYAPYHTIKQALFESAKV